MALILETAVCLSVTPDTKEPKEHRQFSRSMSNPGVTSEAQVRYMLQWFGEFSELQREDFLPVLVAAQTGKLDQLATTLASLTCEDKPVSLFQCRIKLFNEWFPTWSEEQRDRLIKAVSDIDSDFGIKLQDALINGVTANGLDEEHLKYESAFVPAEVIDNEKDSNNIESMPASQDNLTVEIAAAS